MLQLLLRSCPTHPPPNRYRIYKLIRFTNKNDSNGSFILPQTGLDHFNSGCYEKVCLHLFKLQVLTLNCCHEKSYLNTSVISRKLFISSVIFSHDTLSRSCALESLIGLYVYCIQAVDYRSRSESV